MHNDLNMWMRRKALQLLIQPFVVISPTIEFRLMLSKPCGWLLIKTLEAASSLTDRNAIQGQSRNTLSDLTYTIEKQSPQQWLLELWIGFGNSTSASVLTQRHRGSRLFIIFRCTLLCVLIWVCINHDWSLFSSPNDATMIRDKSWPWVLGRTRCAPGLKISNPQQSRSSAELCIQSRPLANP